MAKPKVRVTEESLVTFDNAAAGHEGVMSDPDGLLVIKPCTHAEVDFYESAAASHPDFAAFMPTSMGTLTRSSKEQAAALTDATEPPKAAKTAAADDQLVRMHGKALDTELCIVLENIAAGFHKPNILDVKLGARLWDDEAPLAKRARLDDVAAKTTSSSLGFRIAGMQVWRPDRTGKEEIPAAGQAVSDGATNDKRDHWEHDHETHYSKYNKMYGRSFTAEDKHEGFQEYLALTEFLELAGSISDSHQDRTDELLSYFLDEVRSIQAVLEKEESRMYSASILFVYEGDLGAYDGKKALLARETTQSPSGDEDADDEKQPPKLAAVKMIDFAHAKWTPGEGPDENVLQGVRSVISMFEKVEKAFQKSTA